MTERRKGAQLGNHNARRKSLYEKLYTLHQRRLLSQSEPVDLTDEINLQRMITYSLLNKIFRSDNTQEDLFRLLAVISISNIRLASLLKTRYLLSGQSSDNPDQIIHDWIEMSINKTLDRFTNDPDKL